jgi:toxin YoeB
VKVLFAPKAWDEYQWWQLNDRKVLKRINLLIRDIMRDDSENGVGKPERLREDLSGFSSRRITDEHRLVYRVDVEADVLEIVQCRYHYSDR